MFVLKKKIRDTLLTLFICLAVIAVGLTVFEMAVPKYESITTNMLEAQCEARIIYDVHMKDNPIYEEDVLPEGGYYLKPFTDYINIQCELIVNADQPAEIGTDNSIDIVLVSQLGADDEAVVIWEKKKALGSLQSHQSSDGLIEVNREAKLYFDEYDGLINELIEEHELVTDYYIKVLFNTSIAIAYGDEEKVEPLDTEIIIPFNNQIYNIDGNKEISQEIVFEHETTQQKSTDFNLVILYAAMFIISAGVILMLILKTKAMTKEDEYSVNLSKIFKKYGDRLAGLSEAMAYQSSVMISIDKIDDMVKIADEIGQTIFYYKVEDESERKIEFYIFDEGKVYYLVMFGEL